MNVTSRTRSLRASPLAAVVLIGTTACGDSVDPEDRRFEPTEQAVLSTGSPGKDEDPAPLRARDGALYLAWFSDRTPPGDIYITRTRGGTQWETPIRVSTSNDGDFNPSLVQDDDGVFHLTWFRWNAPFRGHIMYNRSTDGTTWRPEDEVQVTTTADVDDWVPTIVQAPNGTLLIVFASEKRAPANRTDLYVVRKPPGETGWSAPEPLNGVNSATMHDHLPYALRVGDRIGLVWERHDASEPLPWLNTKSDVFYTTSTNGTTWSAPIQVTNEANRVVNLFPALYRRSDAWSILWLSTREGEPRPYDLSTVGAAGYPDGVSAVSPLGPGYSHRVVQTESGDVFLGVWVIGPDGAQDIMYRFFVR